VGARRSVLLVCIAVVLAVPAHADAAVSGLPAPAVYLKEIDPSNRPQGEWTALNGAAMHSITGYELGVAIQPTAEPNNRQRILVEVTSVPDGHPDQPNVYSLCVFVSGQPGEIVMPDERIRYEGEGSYGVSVTASTGSDQSADCKAGTPATGTFTVTAPSTIAFVGRLLITDWRDPAPFSGATVAPPPGAGATEVRCARDPQPAADGSLTGSKVKTTRGAGSNFAPVRFTADNLFPTVGVWACVTRGTGGGDTPSPWSPPTPAQVVQTGFYPAADGQRRITDARGPRVRITERFGRLAAGGRITALLKQRGKKGTRRVTTKVAPDGKATIDLRLPAVGAQGAAFVLGIAFGGTRFVAARPGFADVAFGATRGVTGRGPVRIAFSSPCLPRRC
jgi:hypothetical protein